jgi:hypothetical protein
MRLISQYHTEVNLCLTHADIPEKSARLSKQYANNETGGITALIRHIEAARLATESTVSRFSENHYNSQFFLHLSATVQWSHELRKFLTVNGLWLGKDVDAPEPDAKSGKSSDAIKRGLKEIGKVLKLLCTADMMLPHQRQAANAAYSLATEFSPIAGGSITWLSKEARVARRVAELYIAQARYNEGLVNAFAEARKRWTKEILVPCEEDELPSSLQRRSPSQVGRSAPIVRHLDGKSPATWSTSPGCLMPKQ